MPWLQSILGVLGGKGPNTPLGPAGIMGGGQGSQSGNAPPAPMMPPPQIPGAIPMRTMNPIGYLLAQQPGSIQQPGAGNGGGILSGLL